MIAHKDAIATARALIGTPYSEMDCIALIRTVIRRSAGGDTAYRCAGTNWLWNSFNNSSKYRHLTVRYEGLTGAQAGMLAFKRRGSDVHHVGLVTGEGTVIHSSSEKGCVVETELDDSWHLLGKHKYICTEEAPDAGRQIQQGNAGPENEKEKPSTMLVREDGFMIELMGIWRLAED